MNREFTFKAVVAVLAVCFTLVFGDVNRAMGILLTVMVFDYASGWLAAWYGKRLDSKIGFKGIVKKVLMLLLVGLAHQIDVLSGSQGVARNAAIGFLVANEGLSIVENAAECGVVIPLLTKALALLKEKAGQQVDQGGGAGG